MPQHQGSKRIGSPRRGMFFLPALVWIIAGIIYMTGAAWIFAYEHKGPPPIHGAGASF